MKIFNVFAKIKSFFTRERVVSLSLLSKVLGLVMLLSFSPTALAKDSAVSNEPYATKIVLDMKSPLVIKLPEDKHVNIVLGESNFDRVKREERENEISNSPRVVLARDYRPAPYDPDLSIKRTLAKRAATAYGIDWKILEAVWQVESGKSWDTTVSSYAGAGGPMQFMPSTWRAYAQDANGDGVASMYSAEDAVFGAAQLLAQSGADSGDINSALFSYNHSWSYVEKVKNVAASIQE